jgi:hypothetical protein
VVDTIELRLAGAAVAQGLPQQFIAGQTAQMYLEMRDVYGNIPTLDLGVDVSIRYRLQPDRDVLLAAIVPNLDEAVRNKNGIRIAFATTRILTIAGTDPPGLGV